MRVKVLVKYNLHTLLPTTLALLLVILAFGWLTAHIMHFNSSETLTYFVWGLIFAYPFVLGMANPDFAFQNSMIRPQLRKAALVTLVVIATCGALTQLAIAPLQSWLLTGTATSHVATQGSSVFRLAAGMPLASQVLMNWLLDLALGTFGYICGLLSLGQNKRRTALLIFLIWTGGWALIVLAVILLRQLPKLSPFLNAIGNFAATDLGKLILAALSCLVMIGWLAAIVRRVQTAPFNGKKGLAA
ncbi:hypothetical protein [Lacticaseibacillus mingshuiensis]|uniref:hypothetical protein n=1 Tax=Lacticaseibacillus mingshuiensis TaxID=2799574 RepID=UPI00194F5C2D|nr:hypothetical protein [Lacticaseibacillus mingshuiensis]